MAEAKTFYSSHDLVREIKECKIQLSKWSETRVGLSHITRTAVGNNTIRGLQGHSGPKAVIVGWASRQFNDVTIRNAIASNSDQISYDRWVADFAESLREHWPLTQPNRKQLTYGQSRKLTNLLLKAYVHWKGLPDDIRNQLLGLLHVPLDEFVLTGIRGFTQEYENCMVRIPAHPSMSSITDATMYDCVQCIIRDVAHRASVPPIYVDVFFWDLNHPNYSYDE